MITMTILGGGALAADLEREAADAPAKVTAAVAFVGAAYRDAVKAHASGRPGPNVVTDRYRQSITLEMAESLGSPSAVIFTTEPQGPRLERGFVGVDSLGRHYNQAPLPHWEPPLEAAALALQSAVAAALIR